MEKGVFSIHISRDIFFVYEKQINVCKKCEERITWPKHAHAQSLIWAVKT